MFSLKDLTNHIEVLDTVYPREKVISGISYHSGKCSEGHLFVCVTGYKTDGHLYLQQAVTNGAVAAIVERFQEHITIPQFRVANSRIALAKLAAAFYDQPAQKMKMIGITATNGKTSTSYMANAMLENAGLTTGLIGTVVVKVADQSIPSELTTPESLDLQHYLQQMVDANVSHVCMEVSSAAMETHRIEAVPYDIVTFNNLSREHIDSHGSFEKYWEIKSSLIKQASADSIAILNLDDTYSASLQQETAAHVITFGLKNQTGHIRCTDLDLSTGRGRFYFELTKPFDAPHISLEPMKFAVELSVPGLHSVYNSMVAITIALLNQVPVEVIQQTLSNFPGVERRFEFIHEEKFTIVDDHFANPGNINVTMETIRFMNYEKLHLLYAIRGSRGTTVNEENAEVIVNWMKKLELHELIATKSVSHVTDKDVVTDEELAVFLQVMEKANINVTLYDELPTAIDAALAETGNGDLLLLAGCQGMDPAASIIRQKWNGG
ncbi:Mur ligase family protein [Paenibacillus yanchengensis]|uniref:Mur ligase family protein n=1 Tax=Paenibacillus yanchengensis TaxID=2035833 RepID=A0ABW4YNF4_9BACL